MRIPLAVLALLLAACTAGPVEDPPTPAPLLGEVREFAPAPPLPAGPVAPETLALLDELVADVPLASNSPALEALGATGDPRALWLVADLIRFLTPDEAILAVRTAEQLSGLELPAFAWVELSDHLLAWDLPAPVGYVDRKRELFTYFEEGWDPFFADVDADIDWREVSWGGVFIDDRPLGDPAGCPGGCIPALDDPQLTAASEGSWYPDDGLVFGVVVGDEAVALPRNQMEVHEMVNITLGGQRLAIPYCTLCGSAQAYAHDGAIVMRTSGLLRRSNKVSYDLATGSVFDTFTGAAVSGPLRADAVVLEQVPVVTSRWDDWRDAHPATRIVAEDGGIGRSYAADPLGGRDADGPIFPIGDTDARLGVHEQVLGVVAGDGTALAFPVAAAQAALAAGDEVALEGVRVVADAGGLVATAGGERLPSHQAFWFAWSQFHPDTLLWSGGP